MSNFNRVNKFKPRTTVFNMSHEKQLSARFAKLYPIYLDEIVPGDKFSVKSQVLIRVAPLIAPVMHQIDVYVHYFFVPNRLIFDDWEKFITGEMQTVLPGYSNADPNPCEAGKLGDYLGLPIRNAGQWGSAHNVMTVNALPFRAYNKIYNEFYRDENLQTEVSLDQQELLYRAWEKDYFTSALPWTQKGGSATVPFDIEYRHPDDVELFDINGNPVTTVGPVEWVGGTGTLNVNSGVTTTMNIHNIEDEQFIDINKLRLAEKLQRWLERNARAGTRYVEHLLAHWGVTNSDYRLQRPEYLGGGKQPVVISEVVSTAETSTLPQGNMAGHGISVGQTNQFKKFFTEHGYVIGIMSIIPKTGYFQGIPKHFLRSDKFDFYFPEFAHLGEQEVLNAEIYFQTDGSTDPLTFGYQERFAEYRYAPNTVHGEMRTTLKHWHIAREFANQPNLNADFIKCNPRRDIFPIEDDIDTFYVYVHNNVIAKRPLPYFGTPKL